ncbi:hypothetical protein SRHO_G00324400 [Serrasalmus rhombeus]
MANYSSKEPIVTGSARVKRSEFDLLHARRNPAGHHAAESALLTFLPYFIKVICTSERVAEVADVLRRRFCCVRMRLFRGSISSRVIDGSRPATAGTVPCVLQLMNQRKPQDRAR